MVITLVALRVVIGWHFYKEGAKKFTEPGFSADPFLRQSTGPLAGLYQGMIPDPHGIKRLDPDNAKKAFETYRDRVITVYPVDEEKRKAVDALTAKYVNRFNSFLEYNDEDLEKFRAKYEQWETAKNSPLRYVPHQQERINKYGYEMLGLASPLLKQVDTMREDFRLDLLTLVVADANAADDLYTADDNKITARILPIKDPAAMPLIDNMVKWTVILVGVFLLLGLFTRFWAIVGAGFLLSVVTSQWPGWAGAQPTYYQGIELIAVLVIFATAAGRFAGLDFFIDAWWRGAFKATDDLPPQRTAPVNAPVKEPPAIAAATPEKTSEAVSAQEAESHEPSPESDAPTAETETKNE